MPPEAEVVSEKKESTASRLLKLLLKIGITVLCFWYISRKIDFARAFDALRHAKDRREVVSLSRSQYEGWCAWLESRGIEPPDYHSFGCIAYRHLASG